MDAFKTAHFKGPVELLVQGATAKPEDSELFDEIARQYADVPGLSFLHANLIGPDWDKALLESDAILMPYGAERYRYHWSAMLYTAIGFYKPVLVSPEINPEVLRDYHVGEILDMSSVDTIRAGLEQFVNKMIKCPDIYEAGLVQANDDFCHKRMVDSIINV